MAESEENVEDYSSDNRNRVVKILKRKKREKVNSPQILKEGQSDTNVGSTKNKLEEIRQFASIIVSVYLSQQQNKKP
ncbi:MAG: hypothetical protein KGM98_08175 [Bacteroidota bacterium]|nr:hypothetical protein [Bacteroidota bacterium]